MLRVPNNLFTPKNQDEGGRLGKVYIYALNTSSVGITPEYALDWDRIALYRKTWKAQREGSNWRIHLPEAIQRFYLTRNGDTKLTTSVNGGRIIITVTRE